MLLCNTCVDAGPGCWQTEVELKIFRQERCVTLQWEAEAETDYEGQVKRVAQQSPTGARQVCNKLPYEAHLLTSCLMQASREML